MRGDKGYPWRLIRFPRRIKPAGCCSRFRLSRWDERADTVRPGVNETRALARVINKEMMMMTIGTLLQVPGISRCHPGSAKSPGMNRLLASVCWRTICRRSTTGPAAGDGYRTTGRVDCRTATRRRAHSGPRLRAGLFTPACWRSAAFTVRAWIFAGVDRLGPAAGAGGRAGYCLSPAGRSRVRRKPSLISL